MSLHAPNRRKLTCLSSLALLLFFGLFAAGTVQSRPNVKQVTFMPRSDGMGYVIRIQIDGHVAAYSKPKWVEADQLRMTLYNTDLARSYRHIAPAGPVVDFQETASSGHLVLDFHTDPHIPVSAEAYRDRLSTDILVGLTYGTERRDVLPMPVRPVTRLPNAFNEQQPLITPSNNVQGDGERWRLDTIVIDPGHGGRDPGNVGNGIKEKDIVLPVALKLGGYIEEKLGIKVVYTRRNDQFIELSDRGHIANQAEGKLFISIHANGFNDHRPYGTETYFLGMHKNESARLTMEAENSVVKLESNPDQYNDMNAQALIRQTLAQSAYMRNSEELAGLIEDQFETRVGRNSRGVKQAGFYVLWGASMPAVLVELGFLSNRNEAAFLSSKDGQAYMASAIFRAVRDYKEQYEKGLSLAASQDSNPIR